MELDLTNENGANMSSLEQMQIDARAMAHEILLARLWSALLAQFPNWPDHIATHRDQMLNDLADGKIGFFHSDKARVAESTQMTLSILEDFWATVEDGLSKLPKSDQFGT
jgi:hypothetical protein